MEQEAVSNVIEDVNLHKPSEELKQKFSFFRQGDFLRDFWPHDSVSRKIKVTPVIITEYGTKSNEIVFNINSSGFMDPYTSKICFQVKNVGAEDLILDHSAHSFISEMQIFVNGNLVERYQDYGITHKFKSIVSMTDEERQARRLAEGFTLYTKSGVADLPCLIFAAPPVANPREAFFANNGNVNVVRENNPMLLQLLRLENEIAKGVLEPIPNPIPNFFARKERFKMLYDIIKSSRDSDALVINDIVEPIGRPLDNQATQYREFKLNFESCLFGSLIPRKNWKLIPLKNFKIQVKLILSQDYGTNIDGTQIKTIRILNPKFTFREYNFSEEWNQIMLSKFQENGLISDYNNYEIVFKKWLENVKPQMFYVNLKLPKKYERVRTLYAFFRRSLQNIPNPHSRVFSLFNSGYTKIQIQNELATWPSDEYYLDYECFSYKSNLKYIKNLRKNAQGFENSLKNDQNKRLCLNHLNLTTPCDSINRSSMAHNAIFFDTVPYGDVTEVTGGIPELKADSNYIISFKRTDRAQALVNVPKYALVIDSIADEASLLPADNTDGPVNYQNYKDTECTLYIMVENVVKVSLSLDGTINYL